MKKTSNSLLSIKPDFVYENRHIKKSPYSLNKTEIIALNKIEELRDQIIELIAYWKNNNLINKVLVTARYRRIVPKSNMLCRLLAPERHFPYEYIVGARYDSSSDERKTVDY